MTKRPFTDGKDPALGLNLNSYSESFSPISKSLNAHQLSKPTHACLAGHEDQKTAVNTKDTPAVDLDRCNSIPHLLNLFTEPY